jgi:outer membrane protein TolC
MKTTRLLFILLLMMGMCKIVTAQESILPDISEPYVDKLVAVAKANYPRIKQNQAKIDEAKSNISKAGVSYLDAFSISYVYQPQSSTVINGQAVQSYFNGFQAGVFFNIGTFLEKPFAVRAAKEEYKIATEDQDEYMLTLTNNVKKRYYTYVETIATLKLQTQSVQDAQNSVNDVKHRFEKGELTFDSYTKAQTELTNSYKEKILAETNLLIAKADLEELLGEKLEDIK